MSDRRVRLWRVRRSAWTRGGVAMLAATLALLPAACLCAPAAAPVPASHATTHPCHGGDEWPASSAPAHQPGCPHCQAGVALAGAAQATPSLPAASPVTLAGAVARLAAPSGAGAPGVAPSPAHPPGRILLQHKCVLLV